MGVGVIGTLLDTAQLQMEEPLEPRTAPADLAAPVRESVATHQGTTERHRG